MRKAIMMLGTILIAAVILISGSAVAGTWHYGQDVVYEEDCTDSTYILYAPDNSSASIGVDFPSQALGKIHIDLGASNYMDPGQYFTVFGGSSSGNEEYDVWVSEDDETVNWEDSCGRGSDTTDEVFQTPLTLNKQWRYIYIEAVSGDASGGLAYGPDLDAVGWYEP